MIVGKNIALVGNPNVGKSVVFGLLTGTYANVSNYPGTTVEITSANIKLDNTIWSIIDTPGVDSLIPMSEDEKVTRDILMEERIEKVIQVADAKNLARSLAITLQLGEMEVPLVLDLNMADEARARKINIDEKKLSSILGIPVILTSAVHCEGTELIKEALKKASFLKVKNYYDSVIETSAGDIAKLLPESHIAKRSVALMLLAGDHTLQDWLSRNVTQEITAKIDKIIAKTEEKYEEGLEMAINLQRIVAAEKIAHETVAQEKEEQSDFVCRFGQLCLSPFWGLVILGIVLFGMYLFIGKFVAGDLVDYLQKTLFGVYINPAVKAFINKLIPFAFWQDLLIGEYGLITMALMYAFAIVLPILCAFFLFFSILEDSGYLPRLAVMANSLCRCIGLNGKAILPLVLGLGCGTMAVITTRILETRKERIIAILLLTMGVPCSAQLGVVMAALAKLSPLAFFIWAGVILAVLLLTGYLADRFISGKKADFILEIPPMRIPKWSNILIKTLSRVKWYIVEAIPLFMLGALILFVLAKTGMLAFIQNLTKPLVSSFLGLPEKAAESFIIGFLKKDYGAAGLYALASKGMLDHVQVLVSMVAITLFVPCINQTLIMIKEQGWKVAFAITSFVMVFAFLVAGVVNFALRFLRIPL